MYTPILLLLLCNLSMILSQINYKDAAAAGSAWAG